ncbi:RES family NAD+ phosphorylase [Stutzerimonas stutzeri]|uniref:RES family NAD+ phosphorylase n=1 Tax=Stutzerimonas stutzeri TaxID=316 RepID=UPI0009B931E0|nr:RES family NAD+ phosphorylase [Stutzerimonas stutzeri]
MPAYCCPECFGDRGLKQSIIPLISKTVGRCDFCDATEQNLVEPQALAEWFHLLISIYEPDTNGKLLVERLKEDWELFLHPRMDIAHAKELLGEILDDGDIVRRNFSPSEKYKSEVLVRWETLRDELMYKNRYFLDEPLDTDRLKELLDHLPADNLPQLWYRARIRTGQSNYDIKDMGPPPNRLASHGRANPPGIPYLYVGSQPDTAASEVRPHTGEVACVAEFAITTPLRAVDLRHPRRLVSPFLLGDASAIGQLRADIPFLERLGEELTRPVLPQGAAIDYVPSQYLCEFIKKSGYDGVIYRSSVSDGMNLALFNPAKATGGNVSLYKIKRVLVDVQREE